MWCSGCWPSWPHIAHCMFTLYMEITLYMKIRTIVTVCQVYSCAAWMRADPCAATCRSTRRKRNATLFFIEGTVQWLNLVFWVVPNVYLLVNPCYFLGQLIFWCGWARWTCWNTVSFAATLLYTCFMVRLLLLALCCRRCYTLPEQSFLAVSGVAQAG